MNTLRLRNFQAWGDAQISMKGLTIMVGPSCLGKSSFGRAIRKSLRNEVLPNNIRLGTPKVEIDLSLSGLELHVERGAKAKDSTVYKIGEEFYEKLGGDIPQQVKDLRFGPVEVNGTTIDPIFAGQFDQQFLVGAKPAELNAVLNAFASTEKLDRGRKAMGGSITDINARAKALAPQISGLEEQEAELGEKVLTLTPTLADINGRLVVVQRLDKAKQALEVFRATGKTLEACRARLDTLDTLATRLTFAVKTYKATDRAQRIQDSRAAVQVARRRIKGLGDLVPRLEASVRCAKAAQTFRTYTNAWMGHKRSAAHAGYIATVEPCLQEATRRGTALRNMEALQQAITRQESLTTRTRAVGTLTPALNRSLILYKAMVRVKAVLEVDPSVPRALAQQIHELPTAKPVALLKTLLATQRLQHLTEISSEASSLLKAMELELISTRDTQAHLEAQVEEARSAGIITTCPKCNHEFTVPHTH